MPRTKLTLEDIDHILKLATIGMITQTRIAENFGISKSYVSRLVTGDYKRLNKLLDKTDAVPVPKP
jgi:DNA-directed RNA polymerase specialized sigma subunit